jgi:RNA 2',3'-cyclic 3'-phosphodiesterase
LKLQEYGSEKCLYIVDYFWTNMEFIGIKKYKNWNNLMKKRLFIAIPIPDDKKNILLKQINFDNLFKITKKENIHITLMFLGDTEENLIPEIIKNLEESLKKIQKINLSVNTIGQFPPKGIPNIIYFTGEKGKSELISLSKIIKNNLKKINLFDSKDFNYHITIARLNKNQSNRVNIELPEINDKIEFIADKIILYQSELYKTGPVYTPIWQKELS